MIFHFLIETYLCDSNECGPLSVTTCCRCHCAEQFTGASCDSCADNRWGPDCAPCPECGHGECDTNTGNERQGEVASCLHMSHYNTKQHNALQHNPSDGSMASGSTRQLVRDFCWRKRCIIILSSQSFPYAQCRFYFFQGHIHKSK